MSASRHLAVDLGASGGRVALGTVSEGKLSVEILHRWSHGAIPLRGGLYWDVLGIWREILTGLTKAGGNVASVGVNSWGVDYGLLDGQGNLLDGVHHYRSPRTEGVMESVLDELGAEWVYDTTGIQFMSINTAYQLRAHKRGSAAAVAGAARMLNVPDLMHYWLSGQMANERTIASTTQLYDPRRRDWAYDLIRELGLSRSLFGRIVDPGTTLGPVSDEVAELTGLHGTQVVVPASHDTASAVAAVPAQGEGWAYVSSGTWSLVGVETAEPHISYAVREANLTNEAGVRGTTRLLKNVMGLWILQECRRAWGDAPYDELYSEAEQYAGGKVFDPDAPQFLAPGLDMPDRVTAASGATTKGEIVRAIFDSLATKTSSILDTLEGLTGQKIETLHIVGGGSQIDFLNRLIAQTSGRRVVAGPVEATLTGNLLVQAEACGSIPAGTLRDVVRAGSALREYR